MSNQIRILREVLKHLETYEKEKHNDDILEFSIYLKDQVYAENKSKDTTFDKSNYKNYKSYPEVEFSTLLTTLFRFAKHYMKKAFENSKIKTIDEFGFLASLLREKSLLKKELIQRHLLETSSGSEILKRLIKNGLIQEHADDNDKRAKRVSLTYEGRNTIFNSFDEMHQISEIIIGKLTGEELKQALVIFNKLSYFHHEIYKNDKQSSLEMIRNKYIKI